jgi:hypothetical protein
MKKIIQICSLLSLIVAFSIVSANAQAAKKITADIPFDFNIGAKHYTAGQYNLTVSESRSTGAIVRLTDAEGDILGTVLVLTGGEAVPGESKLVFNNYEGQRFLAEITTADGSYRIIRSGVEREIASGKKPATRRPEVVAIALRTEL